MTAQATNTNKNLPLFAYRKLSDLPGIGAEWPGQGGRFAGIVRGQDGAPDCLLILGPEYDGELPWQQAMDWAANFSVDGHNDYTLPTRSEQAILFGNTRDQFQRDGYWSCAQHAEFAVYAWMQLFNYGDQSSDPKGNEWRARAVRRLVIQ
jgi:hypothetical protein